MKVKFWGTRGSIPTPSTKDFSTVEYGGNTPCIEVVSVSGDEYALDAGSGARSLGIDLMKRYGGKVRAKFFISHPHWDHIQGWPFFAPAFNKDCEIDLHCGDDTLRELRVQNASTDTKIFRKTLEQQTKTDTVVIPKSGRKNVTSEIFGGQQNSRNFPVPIEGMHGIKSFMDLKPGRSVEHNGTNIGYLRFDADSQAHPNGMYVFKLTNAGRTLVYTGDYESDNGGKNDIQMMGWAKEADLLIADGQYTANEYDGVGTFSRKTWGHSTPEGICQLASKANVRRLIITHHEPMHDDAKLAEMEAAAKRYMQEELGRKHIEVYFAREGMEIEI